MNIPFVVETVLHDGLLKYKFKNSKIRSITTKPGKSKGAIFAYRSKKSMIGGRGVVLTSEEAIHENQDTFTHWTPNVYRYGTYADENRSYTKGHSENNLRQINTFFIDFDIHTAKETISASDILTTAIDLGFMPTLIIKSDKGYQAYFVLETPVYVTSKSEFKSVKAAKIISQNIREYFGKSLPVDLTCNHFGIARIPRTDNVEFFDPNYRYSFKEWQDWSFKQTDNKGFTRSSLTVLSGTEGKKQVDEPWFNLLLHETKFSGEKGLIGRNNVMFTLSLAYFSSGYSIETCEYNMFEFNNRLDQPLEEKEADEHGNVIYLGERDCSLQRRNQKVLEESPSPIMTEDLRRRMGEAAVRAAKACGYANAGTVEFLVDKDLNFYFMEMNARIQVEHPVTEMVTGVDLVKAQINIAAGLPLQYKQEDIKLSGHVIECRINAEEPKNNFRPCPGKIKSIHMPGGFGVRIDTAVYQGYEIPPYYDSMIAKVLVKGEDRKEAIQKMKVALSEFLIEGINTNIDFQLNLLRDEDVESGNFDIGFLNRKDLTNY